MLGIFGFRCFGWRLYADRSRWTGHHYRRSLRADLPIGATTLHVAPLNAAGLSGIALGSVFAFFAFIGFEEFMALFDYA